jgi:hypothetical protein
VNKYWISSIINTTLSCSAFKNVPILIMCGIITLFTLQRLSSVVENATCCWKLRNPVFDEHLISQLQKIFTVNWYICSIFKNAISVNILYSFFIRSNKRLQFSNECPTEVSPANKSHVLQPFSQVVSRSIYLLDQPPPSKMKQSTKWIYPQSRRDSWL